MTKNISRDEYLEKIGAFINKPVIKIITGIRRSGKSYFLKQIIEKLIINGTCEKQILLIDKELVDFDHIKDYEDLHKLTDKYFDKRKKNYLFIDEVQKIQGWENAINSIFKKANCDIYLTGSNAYMLSSELATYLSGRYIEFPIFTLSFKEFLKFRGRNKPSAIKNEFKLYRKFGGFPALHNFDLEESTVYPYLTAIYNSILLKDVVAKNDIRNVSLLENLARFSFDNIGSKFSAKSIADYLKSQNIKIGTDTAVNYLKHLNAAYILYKVPRFDIKGGKLLEIYEKYFLGDIAIKSAVLGFREAEIGGLLENIVFLELMRRGYRVNIGKLDNLEIDFIAKKEDELIYIQIAYLLESPETIEREFKPLLEIQDNYPKLVLSMDEDWGKDYKGVKRLNIIDFLLSSF
jgi:uncharacterized protein